MSKHDPAEAGNDPAVSESDPAQPGSIPADPKNDPSECIQSESRSMRNLLPKILPASHSSRPAS